MRFAKGILVIWMILGVFCLFFGALALIPAGRRKGIRSYLSACLPGGQIWYTLKVAERNNTARRVEHLLWWTPALAFFGAAAAVWAFYFYSCAVWGAVLALVPVAFLSLILVIIFYIWIRVLEFRGLNRLLHGWQLVFSVMGTIFFVPIQRLMLFWERKTLR